MRLGCTLCVLICACGSEGLAGWTLAEPERVEPAERTPDPEPEAQQDEPDPAPVLAIDTHVDTTQRMLDDGADLTTRLAGGHLDIPRMRDGGLHAAFFSIWVDPREFPGEAAWERAKALTAAVRRVAETHPDVAVIATTAADVRNAAAEGRVALLIGVEGAHALGSADPDTVLARLGEMYDLGARYMTITWSTDNPLGHSSTGAHAELGLTELGRRVVREMNRLGMIVDVSHVSDQTFSDIMDVTERPVLASHSSARALAEHPRNMTDAMIRRVGEGGGAVCINYYSQYIDIAYRDRRRALEERHADRFEALATEHGDDWIGRSAATRRLAFELDPTLEAPTLETLGAHFAHVVSVAGPEAVCLGSDFDGIPELPVGLEDVSRLPALRAELERRGLDVRAAFGENVLRVLDAQSEPSAQP
jgi:membrane dipeptidase